jgi:hypothetical protein
MNSETRIELVLELCCNDIRLHQRYVTEDATLITKLTTNLTVKDPHKHPHKHPTITLPAARRLVESSGEMVEFGASTFCTAFQDTIAEARELRAKGISHIFTHIHSYYTYIHIYSFVLHSNCMALCMPLSHTLLVCNHVSIVYVGVSSTYHQ